MEVDIREFYGTNSMISSRCKQEMKVVLDLSKEVEEKQEGTICHFI